MKKIYFILVQVELLQEIETKLFITVFHTESKMA
jgi:hypothetical protein